MFVLMYFHFRSQYTSIKLRKNPNSVIYLLDWKLLRQGIVFYVQSLHWLLILYMQEKEYIYKIILLSHAGKVCFAEFYRI